MPFRKFLLCLLLLTSFGCREKEIVSDVSAKESFEILVALNRVGVSANREKQDQAKDPSYSIRVGSADYMKAAEVLHEFGLPRDKENSLKSLTDSGGLFSNSKDLSRLRFDIAVAKQVEGLIETYPGVLSASAIVRSTSSNNGFLASYPKSEPQETAKALVVVRYSADVSSVPFDQEAMKEVVTQAVPGLRLENVFIDLRRTQLFGANSAYGYRAGKRGKAVPLAQLGVPPFAIEVAEHDKKKLRYMSLSIVLLSALSCTVLGVFLGGWLTRNERRTDEERRELGDLESAESPSIERPEQIEQPRSADRSVQSLTRVMTD